MQILTVIGLSMKKEKDACVAPAGSVIKGEGKVTERRGNREVEVSVAGKPRTTLTCDPC